MAKIKKVKKVERSPKVTSIGNKKKKHVRDNSKNGQRQKKGRS